MSRRSQAAERMADARRQCEDLMEPLWKPAPHIRGRHTPPAERTKVQAQAKRAAFDWLGHKLGVVFEFTDFDALTSHQLAFAASHMGAATIYTVERDPAFASTPYGAAMIAHWNARQAAWREQFGDAARFNQHQRDRQRQAREARTQ